MHQRTAMLDMRRCRAGRGYRMMYRALVLVAYRGSRGASRGGG